MEKAIKAIILAIIAIMIGGCGLYGQAIEHEKFITARDAYVECLKKAKSIEECEKEKAILEAYRPGVPVEVKVED